MTDQEEKTRRIVNAFLTIAKTNNYLVGFVSGMVSLEELQKAEQVLIIRSNSADNADPVTERALELVALEIKGESFTQGRKAFDRLS